MQAYEATLNATSTHFAPWYAIPTNNKNFARVEIAKIICHTLENLGCEYPQPKQILLNE